MQRTIGDEQEWDTLAALFAKAIGPGFCLYLSGELGAGKTTFTRCFLRQLGVLGPVKSPTYALVESYTPPNAGCSVHHFDLYRLQSPVELHYIGLEDYFSAGAIVILEWPEKGEGVLPLADIVCTLAYDKSGRSIHCVAHSARGHRVLEEIG